MIDDPNDFLRALFAKAVAVADPMVALPDALPPKPTGRLIVVGAGKASARMAEALVAAWGPCEGLVITRYGYERPCAGIRIASAAHPVPDAAGEAATLEMLELMRGLGADDTVICLISGGASSLLTAPVPGVTLDELQQVNADFAGVGCANFSDERATQAFVPSQRRSVGCGGLSRQGGVFPDLGCAG